MIWRRNLYSTANRKYLQFYIPKDISDYFGMKRGDNIEIELNEEKYGKCFIIRKSVFEAKK